MRGKHMNLSEAKETLGVSDGYTLQEARSARNSLVKRYHPDVNDDPKAEEILKRINEAYRVLIDSFDVEQERVRAKQAAERERARREKAAEQERARKAAERERARRAEQEESSQQERQHRAAEEQWRRRTAEAHRDRVEQSRRQRERWEAMQRGQGQRRQKPEEKARQRERREAERREELEQEYDKAIKAAVQASTPEQFDKVAAMFKALGNYRDSQYASARFSTIAKEARQRERREAEKREREYLKASEAALTAITAEEHKKVAAMFKALGNYRDSESRSAFHNSIADEKKRERLEQEYLKASEAALTAITAEEHKKVAAMFKALGNYRDSESRSAFHSGIADEKRIFEQREAEAKSKRAIALPIMSTTAASIAILAASYICSGLIALGASLMLFGWMVPFSGYELLRRKTYDADDDRVFGRFGFGLPFAEALAVSTIGPHSMDAEVIKQVLILLVASQCVGSIGCMLGAKTESSMTLKKILACASFALLIMGVSKLAAA